MEIYVWNEENNQIEGILGIGFELATSDTLLETHMQVLTFEYRRSRYGSDPDFAFLEPQKLVLGLYLRTKDSCDEIWLKEHDHVEIDCAYPRLQQQPELPNLVQHQENSYV